nr:adenylate/guanylate cyclase domain-containing protein [Candidatus Gastranaerophilales bacterium]
MKKNLILFSVFILFTTVIMVIALHSNVFQQDNNFLIRNISFIITIIFSIIQFITVRVYSKRIASLGILLLFFIYSVFALALSQDSETFTRSAIILTQSAIILFVMVCAVIIDEKTKNRIKQEVSKYVADQVLDNIDNDSVTPSSMGSKEVLTIMFIDIRGFTTISENHSADEVTKLLNSYFKEIIPVIKKHKGVINKFIGDAMLIVFNAKTPEEHAQNAVRAGRDILRKLKSFQHLQEAQGQEKITAGIGINTGEVFVGYIGSDDRCEYTVIGDTVNIASRTESTNRLYKTEFLITENTYNYVKSIADVIKISDVQLKGKREKVNVYEVLRVAEI